MSLRSSARLPLVLAAALAGLAVALPASAEPPANGWHPSTVSVGTVLAEPPANGWHPSLGTNGTFWP